MRKVRFFVLLQAIILLLYSSASAQFPVVSVDDVKSRMKGKEKVVVIDARTPEEYREAHIAGAINIPAADIARNNAGLPKDKTTPLIFYCRGVG